MSHSCLINSRFKAAYPAHLSVWLCMHPCFCVSILLEIHDCPAWISHLHLQISQCDLERNPAARLVLLLSRVPWTIILNAIFLLLMYYLLVWIPSFVLYCDCQWPITTGQGTPIFLYSHRFGHRIILSVDKESLLLPPLLFNIFLPQQGYSSSSLRVSAIWLVTSLCQ